MAPLPRFTGKTDVMIALPGATAGANPQAMRKLGEAQDMIDPIQAYYFNDVPGDRNGGPQGPPIERQMLGLVVTINIDLSMFDTAVLQDIKKHNIWDNAGKVAQNRVGTFMFLRNAFRLVLRNEYLDDDGVVQSSGYNFPCSVLAAPIREPRGTKFTTLSLTMEAHRAPEGHVKAEIVWDTDLLDPQ